LEPSVWEAFCKERNSEIAFQEYGRYIWWMRLPARISVKQGVVGRKFIRISRQRSVLGFYVPFE